MRRYLHLLPLILALKFSATVSFAAEKWPGVDETVVQKIAGEHGRQASKPLIPIEGDMQLFAFLLAGTVGGFAAGYWWRVLMEGSKGKSKE